MQMDVACIIIPHSVVNYYALHIVIKRKPKYGEILEVDSFHMVLLF